MRVLTLAALAALLTFATGSIIVAQTDLDIEVQVAPHTLLLGATQGEITVHAEIPYSLVDPGSVMLEGVENAGTFADDCGDLVAKFDEDEVKDLFDGSKEPTTAMLTLTGKTNAGDTFKGSDTVNVRVWQSGKR